MILNAYNFLRWEDSTPSTDQPLIPWAYWRDRERCFTPVAYPSESMSFYINRMGDFGLNYASFSDIRLALINASTGGVVNGNIGTLQQHYLDAPTNTIYNIHCTFDFPAAADGYYKLRIYRQTGTVTLCDSSLIRVSNDKARLDITTALFKFRHDRYFYGIKYADLPSFYQQFRLPCSITDRQVDNDKEVYRESTTGKPRTLQNYLARWIKLEMYYLDQDGHEAASIMFDHDFIQVNGRRHRPRNAYKELTNQLSKTTKGEIELWE